MKRISTLILGTALALTVAAVAFAQTGEKAAGDTKAPSSGQSGIQASPPTGTPPTESTPPVATPPPNASPVAQEQAVTKSNPALDRIKEKGQTVAAKDRETLEKKLDEVQKQIEAEASSKGDATVAGRIAGEFGLTADALTAERAQFSRGWGEIVVAHTLLANAKTPGLTIADMFQLRNDGLGWGQIAHGLNLRLGEVASAVRSEGRVATGLAKADGKPATIRSGAAAAGTKASTKAQSTKETTKAGTGVGGGVDINKGAGGK